MGFASYGDYLKSDLWLSIRRRVLAEQPRCYACKRKAWQVHHRRYDGATLRGEVLSGMVAVCKRCHSAAERRRGRKVALGQANAVLERMRRKRGRTKGAGWCRLCERNRASGGGACPPCRGRLDAPRPAALP
jgi:hypothetical protein